MIGRKDDIKPLWIDKWWVKILFLCLIIYEYSIICVIIIICIIIIDETNPKSTYTCDLHSQPCSQQIRTNTERCGPSECTGYIIFSWSKNCDIFDLKICPSSWWSYHSISFKFNFYIRTNLFKSIILSRYQQIRNRIFSCRWPILLYDIHC